MSVSQAEKVRSYLEAGRTLTAPEALSRFKIKNLRARISELRQDGMNIGTVPYVRKTGVSAVKYVLETRKTRRVR